MPYRLKEMTALGTESTIAIQGGLQSEQLTMTQQRGTERWIDRERRFGRDTQTAKKDFQKCHRDTDEQRPTISERLLKWSENLRISIGNNQKLYFMAELRDCGKGIPIMQHYKRKTFPTLNIAIWVHMLVAVNTHACPRQDLSLQK